MFTPIFYQNQNMRIAAQSAIKPDFLTFFFFCGILNFNAGLDSPPFYLVIQYPAVKPSKHSAFPPNNKRSENAFLP